jgi:haloacetate dehalogenase
MTETSRAATELADLFPGFQSHWIDTSAGRLFARSGGSGPPLLMLHGYPQTHVMWHRVAPALAKHFTLILPDLPGYGWSHIPDAEPDHSPYTKRAMANAMVDVMEALGFIRFRLAGHDRGGRVAYRLALDLPGRVEKLATLDIVPTLEVWRGMDAKVALRTWHWPFLAQPAPLPELLIGHAANEYFDLLTAAWARGSARSGEVDAGSPPGARANAKSNAFDPRALAHYRASFTDPSRIHASCEDYRAGATTDVAHDEADRAAGRTITCPMLVLWGARGGFAQMLSPLETWKNWASDVRGHAIESGHFLAEEAPEETAEAMVGFFTGP